MVGQVCVTGERGGIPNPFEKFSGERIMQELWPSDLSVNVVFG